MFKVLRYLTISLIITTTGSSLKAMSLLDAAEKGDADTVRQLIHDGANVHAVDGDEWTALHWAATNGHQDTVTALLQANANP